MIKLLNTLNDYILIIDIYGQVRFCNNNLMLELKYNHKDLENINIKNILYNKYDVLLENIKTNGNFKGIFKIVNKDKEKVILNGEMILEKFKGEECVFLIATRKDKIDDVKNYYNKIETEKIEYNIYNKIEVEVNNILNSLVKDIHKYVNSDSISLYLYDKETNTLNLTSLHGESKTLSQAIKNLTISRKDVKNIIENKIIRNIFDIEDVNNKRIELYKTENKKITFAESYNLISNNVFIGVLNIIYTDKNYPQYNIENFTENICYRLSLIIKSGILTKGAKFEFEKRIAIEKEIEQLLDVSVDMYATINNQGYFTAISKQWSDILGWTNEELKSDKVTKIIHPQYKDEIIKMANRKDTNVNIFINRILSKNGEYLWFKWNYRYINEKKHFLVVTRNITKEKEEEESRIVLEKAIELESIKNEFFANISHELRTPINIIFGTIQLLEKIVNKDNIISSDDYDLSQYIKYIKQNSYRLLKLVNNLIDMTRIDTGFYQLNLGNYNIINIVEEITLSVAQYIEGKGINLIFDTNSEETIIACDPDKIERIVLNILSNAIKYTDEDGEIYTNIKVQKDKVVISIKDNGVGISKEKLPFIFDKFRQIDNILTRRCEGSGIGLSLVKSIVEMHGGVIYVKSAPGYGSEFIFELPIRLIKEENNITKNNPTQPKIEKCNIEFSDIYSL
ncbi:MAG: ATP-binding protein [Romboutsia sp.]